MQECGRLTFFSLEAVLSLLPLWAGLTGPTNHGGPATLTLPSGQVRSDQARVGQVSQDRLSRSMLITRSIYTYLASG